MSTRIVIDDELLARAKLLTGIDDMTAVIHAACMRSSRASLRYGWRRSEVRRNKYGRAYDTD